MEVGLGVASLLAMEMEQGMPTSQLAMDVGQEVAASLLTLKGRADRGGVSSCTVRQSSGGSLASQLRYQGIVLHPHS